MNPIGTFVETMQAAGLSPPPHIEQGKMHRFPGIGKGKGNHNGFCKLFLDGQAGIYGDWSQNLHEIWQAKRDKPLTDAERRAFNKEIKAARAAETLRQERRHLAAAAKTKPILAEATGDPATHPYAVKKGLPLGDQVKRGPWKQRKWPDALLIPIYDQQGNITTIAAIDPDGNKDLLSGGKKKGCFHPLGKFRGATGSVVIGEGLATVAAAVAATGLPGVVAIDADNLLAVAKTVKALSPAASLVLLADDDHKDGTAANPGTEKATAAARAVGGKVALLDLGKKADTWDLWHEQGPAAVVAMIDQAVLVSPAPDHEGPVAESEKTGAIPSPDNTLPIPAAPPDLSPILAALAVSPLAAFTPGNIAILAAAASAGGVAWYEARPEIKRAGVSLVDLDREIKAELKRQKAAEKDRQEQECQRQFEAARAKRDQLRQDAAPYQVLVAVKGYRNGVYFFGEKRGAPAEPEWFCSPLEVIAKTRDESSEKWGLLLRWRDDDDKVHSWAMPKELLSGRDEEYRKVLLDGGLEIANGMQSHNHLGAYIRSARPTRKALCTDRTGWHHGAFVLPNRVIGQCDEEIIFQSATVQAGDYQERGTVAEWRQEIASLCRGNSRLLLSVSTAFASTLLDLTGDENGGFHLTGDSSMGKSTALIMAGSVFGGKEFVKSWRATINGLEGVAVSRNGVLLVNDELAQSIAKEAGQVAYMLANGYGKQRANKIGLAKNCQRWRLLFLSSGEIDLAQHIREGGNKSRAGQDVRLPTIPISGKHGIFDELHGFSCGKELSDTIKERVNRYHGSAGPAFIEQIAGCLNELPDQVKKLREGFFKKYVSPAASGQVQRVANRFALCAIGGELATRAGITGWVAGEALAAAAECFNAWVAYRGGTGKQEETLILDQVRGFFERHGDSRFTTLDKKDDRPTINRAGFKKIELVNEGMDHEVTFYVLPDVFRSELCDGFNQRMVIDVLLTHGILTPGHDGKNSQSVRLPLGQARVYMFRSSSLWREGAADV